MIWRREVHQLQDERVLHVALPEGYDDGAQDYPLLLCLDAQWTFGTVCDASLNLGLARLLPRVVVVGVGWQAAQARQVTRLRAESYTPTEDGRFTIDGLVWRVTRVTPTPGGYVMNVERNDRKQLMSSPAKT